MLGNAVANFLAIDFDDWAIAFEAARKKTFVLEDLLFELEAFENFDPERIARFTPARIEKLLSQVETLSGS